MEDGSLDSEFKTTWMSFFQIFSALNLNPPCSWQVPPIDHFLRQPWNAPSLPMACWLIDQKPPKEIMDTLGNLVVPQQACLAASVLSGMLTGQYLAVWWLPNASYMQIRAMKSWLAQACSPSWPHQVLLN